MSAVGWKLNQANSIVFVMINASGVEVAGLGSGFTLELSKAGAAFQASAGSKAEIGSGWYLYTAIAGEADTIGPIAIKVTGAGAIQQNLEYVVEERTITAVEYTYTLTEPPEGVGSPIDGVACWFCTDVGGLYVVWSGHTDAFGVARDANGALPRLDPGTYYVFRQKAGYNFTDPDTEVVS
ncbi:MAG: hypothetical protein ACXABY_24835 [Candidatus Thorarchaeota archaeon]|jgi:hypothetical protein